MAANLEQLFAPILHGPMTTEATSNSNQWAGVSTLASGSATLTISTAVVNSNSVIRLGTEGNANMPVGGGVSALNSGSATVTVSDARITASSVLIPGLERVSANQTSGVMTSVEVHSHGVGYATFGYADGNTRAFNRNVHWVSYGIYGPPVEVEVRSLGVGYFTLGRANGLALDRDTKIHWMVEKTSQSAG